MPASESAAAFIFSDRLPTPKMANTDSSTFPADMITQTEIPMPRGRRASEKKGRYFSRNGPPFLIINDKAGSMRETKERYH